MRPPWLLSGIIPQICGWCQVFFAKMLLDLWGKFVVNFKKIIAQGKTSFAQKRMLGERPDRLTERNIHETGSY